jgi:hypothetical protein
MELRRELAYFRQAELPFDNHFVLTVARRSLAMLQIDLPGGHPVPGLYSIKRMTAY